MHNCIEKKIELLWYIINFANIHKNYLDIAIIIWYFYTYFSIYFLFELTNYILQILSVIIWPIMNLIMHYGGS